jgi:4-alpha-glucanotransferase
VGTLPLLSSFLDQPFDPSPYAPVSRLFWNELFIDVDRVPEAQGPGAAGNIMGSPRFRKEIGRVRRSRLVDYRALAALKREVLQALADTFFRGPGNRRRETLARFLRERPEIRSYATFRAAAERHRTGWQEWPSPGRDGRIPTPDVDPLAVRYHQYVQLVAEEQLRASRRGEPGRGLYIDLPVGVNPGGYDTWRFRTAFAQGASAGAPPDLFFAEGQDWGFPPMHPDRARDDGYAYFRATVSNLLRHAAMLRIDHAMGLHRMYWIPRGLEATAGVYVRYRPEELYAVLTLESHRAGVPIVGEDLGTVPPDVRPAMSRHGVLRSYVLQLEALTRSGLRGDRESLASLNTHDMPPFRAFWEGLDIEDRLDRGLIDRASARTERAERATQRRMLRDRLREAGFRVGKDARSVGAGSLRYLAAGPSKVVVVNLEDLWGETEPQNRPGTGSEQPNWRRKAARTIEQARSDPVVRGTLEEINGLRRRGPRPGASR